MTKLFGIPVDILVAVGTCLVLWFGVRLVPELQMIGFDDA